MLVSPRPASSQAVRKRTLMPLSAAAGQQSPLAVVRVRGSPVLLGLPLDDVVGDIRIAHAVEDGHGARRGAIARSASGSRSCR